MTQHERGERQRESIDPVVTSEVRDGAAEIEVIGGDVEKTAKRQLDAVSHLLKDPERIFIRVESEIADVEVDDGDRVVVEHDFEDWVPDADEPDEGDEWDPGTINEGTAVHKVATVLRKNGPLTSTEVGEKLPETPIGTVSSTLHYGVEDYLFTREHRDDGPDHYRLSDWGQEQLSEIGEYEVEGNG